uniref:Putative leucine-rich repeat protein n=1 Tax=Aedes albopictus TaxID=7160 RepID=A0A1W7R878_AEDAL
MLRKLIWFQLLFAIKFASASHFQCLPYPIDSVCILEHISYHSGDLVTFPTGYQQYHIRYPRSRKEYHSNVTIFDETLYEAMHRPLRIEMERVFLTELTLPAELMMGNFAANQVRSVNVSRKMNYQITYLDLAQNSLTNIDFVSSLVNLEILHLEYNRIGIIPGSTLSPLTKLKYLYLIRNFFAVISWNSLPASLIHLDYSFCFAETIEFTNVSLPSLEYLNIQFNSFSTINVTALLRAAPSLKLVYLYNSNINQSRMHEIKAELAANNVTFVENYEREYCYYQEDYKYEDGKCIQVYNVPISIRKAVLLTSVVIGVAVLLMYLTWLVFRHMNR